MRPVRLLALLAIVVVALVVLVVTVREVDLSRQQQRIAATVSALTGRNLTIAGGVRVGLAWRPEVVLRDVALANAPWGTRPELIEVAEVRAVLALWPLLHGTVDLVELELRGVELWLETGPDGQGNWELPVDSPDTAAAPLFDPTVFAERVRIEDLHGTWSGADGRRALDLARLELSAASGSEPLELEAQLALAGQPAAVTGRVGSAADWLAGAPVRLDVEGHWERSMLALHGTFSPGSPARFEGTMPRGVLDASPWIAERRKAHEAAPSRPGLLFPNGPLGLDRLATPAIHLSIGVDSLAAPEGALVLQHAAVALKAGRLRIDPVRAAFADRSIDGTLEVDVRGHTPRVVLSAFARALDLGRLLELTGLSSEVAATVDVGASLAAAGDSVAALLASVDGHATLAVEDGEVPTRALDRLVANLARLLMPWTKPPPRTAIECGVVQLRLEAGIARTQLLLFDTEHMTLQGRGSIDLRNETLHVELAPRPRDHALLSLATDLRLGGSLAHPRASPHTLGLLETAVRFATGPARLLVPFEALGARDQSGCVERVQALAAQAARESARSPLRRGRAWLDSRVLALTAPQGTIPTP